MCVCLVGPFAGGWKHGSILIALSGSGTDTRRAWEVNVDSPDDAAEVMPFDQQAADTANDDSIPAAAENNHGAAAARVSKFRHSK